MAEAASEEFGGFHNMSFLFSLKGSYFERVEDVPEYVQQVSFCTSPHCLQTHTRAPKRVLLLRTDVDRVALLLFYHQHSELWLLTAPNISS